MDAIDENMLGWALDEDNQVWRWVEDKDFPRMDYICTRWGDGAPEPCDPNWKTSKYVFGIVAPVVETFPASVVAEWRHLPSGCIACGYPTPRLP